MEDTLTNLILHGHFYQPPRENPKTGLIPKQPSAHPFQDWNEKICSECYKSNVNSRYLSDTGHIVSLTNNFEYISYNFGPTLLSWLEMNHEEAYEKIIEADKRSLARLGHGNAIAQAFNHTILPLDKEKDAKLQIDWGIQDFQFRYGRDPEGIWLPECGINGTVIDLLSSFGIKFVILSPWQCKAVEDESGCMIPLNGKPAPYGQSYLLTGPQGGTVSAFFYHPNLASDISFGHALQSADSLYAKLLYIKNTDHTSLIHTATDGEIYGHHEPFGDMALAALIQKTKERNDFVMTNYGTILEKNPTKLHAILLDGEENRGTSWSCCHGVSRWYKDCGCHTGGEESWNQKWRTPLRKALSLNADRLDSIFANQTSKIFKDQITPEGLLHIAGPAIAGSVKMNKFIQSLHDKFVFNSLYDQDIANLITGMKNKHFSFTSCGFFFSELSGIEPQQDIMYALYAIKLYQKYYSEDLLYPFLSDLNLAKSNIKNQGTGMSLAQAMLNEISGEVEAALYFYLMYSMTEHVKRVDTYGRFILLNLEKKEQGVFVEIVDNNNLKCYQYNILSSSNTEMGLNLYFSDASDNSNKNIFKVTDKNIPERMVDDLTKAISNNYRSPELANFILFTDNLYNSLLLTKDNEEYTERLIRENMHRAIQSLNCLLNWFVTENLKTRLTYADKLLSIVQAYGTEHDVERCLAHFTKRTDDIAIKIKKTGLDNLLINETLSLLKLCDMHSITPDIRNLQNVVYPYYTGEKQCKNVDEKVIRKFYGFLNFQ